MLHFGKALLVYTENMWLGGPQSRSERSAEQKISSVAGIPTRFLGRPVRSPDLYSGPALGRLDRSDAIWPRAHEKFAHLQCLKICNAIPHKALALIS